MWGDFHPPVFYTKGSGFTTFSQFSFDFIELNKNNLFISALYIIASITISIIGAGFGIFLAQKLK